ncbi:hypothetical protein [Gordonia malaquae]|uniref:hypothetical protein n=1 Tax=Gordonia malaquae TaxID=410332 RepID=UPI0030FE2008
MTDKQPQGGPEIPDDARTLSRLRAMKVDPDAVISRGIQESLVEIDEKLSGENVGTVARIVSIPVIGLGIGVLAVSNIFPLEERIIELEKRVKELEQRLGDGL